MLCCRLRWQHILPTGPPAGVGRMERDSGSSAPTAARGGGLQAPGGGAEVGAGFFPAGGRSSFATARAFHCFSWRLPRASHPQTHPALGRFTAVARSGIRALFFLAWGAGRDARVRRPGRRSLGCDDVITRGGAAVLLGLAYGACVLIRLSERNLKFNSR